MYYDKKHVPYGEYVVRQGRKANNPEKTKSLVDNNTSRINKFEKIFQEAKPYLNPGNMLCLGARTGCEAKAAINEGYDAVGMDLYPLDDSVMKGDWHNIPFEESSFENVYTNALDHCYDIEKLALEIKRVLVPDGIFFFQLFNKQQLKTKEDKFKYMEESGNFLFWETSTDIVKEFSKYGFALIKKWANNKNENFIMKVDK